MEHGRQRPVITPAGDNRKEYDEAMASSEKAVHQSITLPSELARRIHALAQAEGTSEDHLLVQLITTGLDAKESERRRFLELSEKLIHSSDHAEQQQLKQELARMTFGE